MNTTKRRPPAKGATKARGKSGGLPLFPIVIGAVVVLGILAVVLASGSGDESAADETAPVTVDGEALPRLEAGADDPAVGMTAPTISGEDFSGQPVTIGPDGNPKVVFFMAHWCPHCQAEAPRLNQWLQTHEMPGDLDVYVVSTRVKENGVLENYPPSEWLEREGLGTLPTIMDSEDSEAYQAYGSGGLPYVVYLDGDNVVQLRTEGEYPADPEAFTAAFEALAAGEQPVDPRPPTG